MKKLDSYGTIPTAWLRREADNDFWAGMVLLYFGATALFFGVLKFTEWGLVGMLTLIGGLLLTLPAVKLLKRSVKLREIADWREFGE